MARRNRQLNNMNRRGTRNWVVGGSGADNSGTPVASRPSWLGTGFACAFGQCESFSLVHIVPAAMSGTPGVGRLRVDRVKGRVFLTMNNSGILQGAVGIYVAELNTTTTKWSVRNPALETDAQRDDYIFLEGFVGTQDNNSLTNYWTVVDIDVPCNVLIGAGEGLFLTIGNGSIINAFNVSAYVRTLIGPVA